jgi:hypothetical protein
LPGQAHTGRVILGAGSSPKSEREDWGTAAPALSLLALNHPSAVTAEAGALYPVLANTTSGRGLKGLESFVALIMLYTVTSKNG